jgi:hypothetical protein
MSGERNIMSASHKPRGRPFQPGNSGRPRGARNKTTLFAEQLLEGEAEQLIHKVIELAQNGDVACLRMALDRILPARKAHPIDIDLPPIKTSKDLVAALASVWNAVRERRVTPEEISALSLLAARSMEMIQMQDVIKRIETLEQERWPSYEA